jgi:hypothetical protein
MLDFEDDASRREKCYTTISELPSYIDPKQPPTKKAPFSAIWGHSFVHTVLIHPSRSYIITRRELIDHRWRSFCLKTHTTPPSDHYTRNSKTSDMLESLCRYPRSLMETFSTHILNQVPTLLPTLEPLQSAYPN